MQSKTKHNSNSSQITSLSVHVSSNNNIIFEAKHQIKLIQSRKKLERSMFDIANTVKLNNESNWLIQERNLRRVRSSNIETKQQNKLYSFSWKFVMCLFEYLQQQRETIAIKSSSTTKSQTNQLHPSEKYWEA